MVALIQLTEPCPKCGKNKFMEEILHVNGREERRHTCLFCCGLSTRMNHSLDGEGNYISRREVRRIHTSSNLD